MMDLAAKLTDVAVVTSVVVSFVIVGLPFLALNYMIRSLYSEY